MNPKTLIVVVVAIQCVVASSHSMVKRQATDTTNQGTDTNRLTQFLSNTWDTLRNRLNSTQSQTRIRQFHSNLTDLRQNLMSATGDAAQDMMSRLQNMTQGLNNLLRERANNDKSLVNRLYGMITNGTSQSGQTPEQLRHALRRAAQTMAENYSGVANSSIQMASDLMNRGRDMFNEARIRAGNDTNRAVKAVNTAIDAIRNSSAPMNQTLRQITADLAQSAQTLSAGLRTLMSQTSGAADSGIQAVASDQTEYRQKAEQTLNKLLSNMERLRNKLSEVSNNAMTTAENNLQNNEINVIENVSTALTREYEALQNQVAQLRRQATGSS